MRQDARKGRSHSHAHKIGNGRKRARKKTIHHPARSGWKASSHEEAPRARTRGASAIHPCSTRESQCESYPQ